MARNSASLRRRRPRRRGGPPFVLVHGLGGTIENWQLACARSRRATSRARPGSAGPRPLGTPRRGADVDALAEAVLGVVRAEELRGPRGSGTHSVVWSDSAPRCCSRTPCVVSFWPRLRGSAPARAAPRHAGGARRPKPGRLIARRRQRLGQLAARPPRCVRLVGGGRPDALEPAQAEAFLVGPAHHTDTAKRAAPSSPRTRGPISTACVSVPLPLGSERQLGHARRRDGVRAPPARPAADDCRLRPPADRRAAGRLSRRDPRLRRLLWRANPPRPAPRTESPRRRSRPPRRASGLRRGTRSAGRPPRLRSAAFRRPPTTVT